MARGIEDVEESRSCTQSWLAYNQRKLNCIAVVVGGATNDVLAMSENKIDKIVQAAASDKSVSMAMSVALATCTSDVLCMYTSQET